MGCCGKNKNKKPNELAADKKRSAQAGKFASKKKSYQNGKKGSS